MENKDFRDRLKQHHVEPNKESWEMMQAMLDSTYDTKRKKKKKRGFFIWFFGTGILVLGFILFMNNNLNQTLDITSKKITENSLDINKSNEKINKPRVKSNEELLFNKSDKLKNKINGGIDSGIVASEKENPKRNQENSLIKTQTKTDLTTTNNGLQNKQNRNSQFDASKNNKAGLPKTESTPSVFLSERNKSLKQDNTEEKTAVENEGKSETDVQGSILNDNNEESKEFDNNNTSDSNLESSVAEQNIRASESKDLLKYLPILNGLNFLERENSIININLKKQSKWMVYGQIGYASFNNNPGLILGSGLLYKFDDLLYFESLISYAFGNEAGLANGEPATHENEIDLGLLVNLNFINSRKSRLALDLGIGLTRYSGTRVIRSMPITLDERSSFGRHIQGGLSYHYTINKNTNLALKFGVISYDDAITYLALKYYKTF